MVRWKINKTVINYSSRAKDQKNLASDDIIDETPVAPKIFNIPTEAKVTDLLEESVTEDSNSNHTPQIEEHNIRDLTTPGEHINNLKKRK